MADLGKVRTEDVNIVLGEADLDSRFLPAGLHAGLAGNDDDDLGPEIGKDIVNGLAKTIAISEQHDHGGNSPAHAQHGQRRAAPIMAHGGVRFLKQVAEHCYSWRRASTGCSRAARRAG
jgi:hypothetical protein